MRNVGIVVGLLAVMVSVSSAQLTATLTIKNFVLANSTYSFEIWGRRTNATGQIFVGISSFFFDYNSSDLGNPTLTNVNANYSGNASSNYNPMTVGIVGGKIAVTINFTGNATGAGTTLSTASPDGERFCTVNLTVANPGFTSGLSWDVVNSSLSTSNSQPVTQTFVGSNDMPLPIQLAEFVAAASGDVVGLQWKTVSETDNYGFEIQRSGESTSGFVTLPNSFVPGNGTTLVEHHYSWVDSAATSAQPWYRLKQIDSGQNITYSEAIEASGFTAVMSQAPLVFRLDQNYPNPFNPKTEIRYQIAEESNVTLMVYDVLGREVATLAQGTKPAGAYAAAWNTVNTASGVYFCRFIATPSAAGKKSYVNTIKMVVSK